MAQTEDTELRDLVIEALEKNGSLAKIRALLRANIFLAFEDDCENIKQNECFDNVLKLPEGVLSLSIIHEFLEFCNLKNTLFVYMSESRQGKEYKVKGQRSIIDTLRLNKIYKGKEPVLITLLKYIFKSQKLETSHESCEHGDHSTYTIDQETSSSTSQSQSDNSSDEKNRLDLRLSLENSDTDTSSDSTRNKNSSEYVPNKNVVLSDIDMVVTKELVTNRPENIPKVEQSKTLISKHIENTKVNNSSSESTSYAELKPFNLLDEKLLNTTGIPYSDTKMNQPNTLLNEPQMDLAQTLSNASSESLKREVNVYKDVTGSKVSPEQSYKYDQATDYSYDFSSIPGSERTNAHQQRTSTSTSNQNSLSSNSDKQNSARSQSSVSISEVTDLISEKSYTGHKSKTEYNLSIAMAKSQTMDKSKSPENISIKSGNESGEFSQSPIPSLSNLSLDYHSD